jgi:hypothetical protein
VRVLLDTNLVIGREDDVAPRAELSDLLRILAENNVQAVVHPATRTELLGDSNEERRTTILAKLAAYVELQVPPNPPDSFREESGERLTPHDRVDTVLLYAVEADAVDFLLTEDVGLLERASRVGLVDRVLNIQAGRLHFSQFFAVELPRLPQYVHKGPINGAWISDPFFDSFKLEYGQQEFPAWYARSARHGRAGVWVNDESERLGALMVYKEENEPLDQLPRRRRLKICSFKVAPSMQGLRLSERLLWFGFNFMTANRIDEAYVDVLPTHSDLITFFRLFGFEEVSRTSRGEHRLMKRTTRAASTVPADATLGFRGRFPGYDDSPGVRKFLVPIQSDWHSRLFPEFQRHPGQRVIDHYSGTTFNFSAAGNAIRKAYICRAPTNQVRQGDLLLFYRSRDVRRVNEIGVVERAERHQGLDAVIDIIGNRTVLPRAVLSRLCTSTVLVILFWHVGPFPDTHGTGVSLDVLGPDSVPPRSISLLDDEAYHILCGRQTPQ